MAGSFRRNLVVVGVVHVIVIGVMFAFTGFRRPKRESPPVNFIPVEIVADTRAHVVAPPEPLPPEPAPEPVVEPEPEIVPDPPPARPKPRPVPKKKNRRKPVTTTRRLTQKDIEKMLGSVTDSDRPATTPAANDATYRAVIRQTFYDAWDQPAYADVEDAVAIVTIRLGSDGTVTQGSITRSSGNSTLDDSVLRAIRAVRRIPGLTSDFIARNRSITVSFRVKDG